MSCRLFIFQEILRDLYVSDGNDSSRIPRREVMAAVKPFIPEDDPQWIAKPLNTRVLGIAMAETFGRNTVTLHGTK